MDSFLSSLGGVGVGLEVALQPINILYCALGVFLGTLVGVLPGIGALAAISMLFPISFHLDPAASLIMLAGVYYGSAYGGSTSAILLNVPGSPSSAVVCLDGYPMARQGRGGVALLMAALASFLAGCVGIVLMMALSPVIAASAIEFGSTEYFSLMIFGLIATSTISSDAPVKSFAMVVLGALFGTVGLDLYSGVSRFGFGTPDLLDGLSLVAVAMGLFGIAEVIANIGQLGTGEILQKKVTFRSMLPSGNEVRRFWGSAARGTGVGSFYGILPGTGPTIASFMAYALEKRVARQPERFGKGAIEGVVSPEAANNAADQTAFIPTMTLGIPGSPAMAILIGALMIHGIMPGPTLLTDRPDVFWGLVMSFWVGNILLLIINVPLIGIWLRLLTIPYHYLYPAILMFLCVGVYSVHLSTFDVFVVVAFGALAYAVRLAGMPTTQFLLGFILSPLVEEHFIRAMIISDGDFMTFVNRPISAVVLALCAALITWSLVRFVRRDQIAPVASGTAD